ncbi:MAG: class I SAM-dependent methyltransferase [Candidatus Omnitrophota bacterium]
MILDKEILENHKSYLERRALYKSFGYDIDKERGFILKQAMPLRGRILEAGTGKGHFALTLAKAGYSFVTFDISPDEQRFAKLNIAHAGLKKQVDFRIENAERTGFASGSFDAIFLVNVLHHLHNPYLVIDELIRILSPKGKLILADFSEEGFRVMDKIHSLQGDTHEAGEIGLAQAEKCLLRKGFSAKRSQTICQYVFVCRRKIPSR